MDATKNQHKIFNGMDFEAQRSMVKIYGKKGVSIQQWIVKWVSKLEWVPIYGIIECEDGWLIKKCSMGAPQTISHRIYKTAIIIKFPCLDVCINV